MYKIGVIGKKESVMCYMASGFEAVACENAGEALAALKKLVSEECAIIFLTEEYAPALAEETAKYKDKPVPAIITVPGAEGRMGYGMQSLRSACDRAVGMNILK